jgi:hypothetical protein
MVTIMFCTLVMHGLTQACPTFFVEWVTSAKFGLYAGNMKFNTQHLECISIHIITYIYKLLSAYFSIHYIQ